MDDDRLPASGAPAPDADASRPIAPAHPGWAALPPPPPPADPHWGTLPAAAVPDGAAPPTPSSPAQPELRWLSAPPQPAPARRRTLLAAFALLLAAVVVFSAGISVGRAVSGPDSPTGQPGAPLPSYSPAAVPDWRLLDEAYKLLAQYYVDPKALDSLTLERGALSGLTGALDDRGHTGYLTPDQVKARDESLSGTFVGVGAVLDAKDGQIVIVRVLRDSPAEKAGVLAGDVIVAVDGSSSQGLTVDQIVSKVRGPEGTQVTLELQGTDGSTRTLTITRQKLDLPLSSWAFVPGTHDAVIRLESFSTGAAKAVEGALRAAMDGGAQGIVLDLRGNPGGYVNEAVSVASQFLSSGVVYESVDRSGTQKENPVQSGGIATQIPLVVLVDDQTASSAEIVTGAIQDAGRAKVVGVKTYGTGTVVNTYPLSDGGALTIGTERWLTPKGRAIWREGLNPDEVVTLPTGTTLVVPDDFATLGSSGLAGTQDSQLKAAVAALDKARAGSREGLARAA